MEATFWIAEKPSKLRAMKNKRDRKYAERWEHFKASLRAKVEHPFRVVKRQFGYTKVRYRGFPRRTKTRHARRAKRASSSSPRSLAATCCGAAAWCATWWRNCIPT